MRKIMAAGAALLVAACGGQSDGDQAKGDNKAAAASADAGGGVTVGDGASVTMEPGLWEMTVQVAGVEMPNMPAGVTPAMPATTVRSCLTPQQVAQPNADFFSGGNAQGCRSENFSVAGGRIQGTITCDAQGTSTRITMDGRFAATSYEMTQRSEVAAGGTNVTTETRVTGRRVGDCPAGG